jgi:hypothetical protein
VGKNRLIAVGLMSMFGVLTCGCRTVIYCFVPSALAYAFLFLKGNRVPIYIGVAILGITLL